MSFPRSESLRQRLLRDGFVVCPEFLTAQELQSLQYEAEVVFEESVAYVDVATDRDDHGKTFNRDVASTRGCIFEVVRPYTPSHVTTSQPSSAVPPDPAPGMAQPSGTPASAAKIPPQQDSSAVALPGLGLLTSPKLHALVREALGLSSASVPCCSGPPGLDGGAGSDGVPDDAADRAGNGNEEMRAATGCAAGRSIPDAAVRTEHIGGNAEGLPSGGRCAGGHHRGPFVFNEQFIVKPPRSGAGAAFEWHRDSDWCRDKVEFDYSPYISVWTALDDMTAENGALAVIPRSHLVDRPPRAAPARAAGRSAAGKATAAEAAVNRMTQLASPVSVELLPAMMMAPPAGGLHGKHMHCRAKRRAYSGAAATASTCHADAEAAAASTSLDAEAAATRSRTAAAAVRSGPLAGPKPRTPDEDPGTSARGSATAHAAADSDARAPVSLSDPRATERPHKRPRPARFGVPGREAEACRTAHRPAPAAGQRLAVQNASDNSKTGGPCVPGLAVDEATATATAAFAASAGFHSHPAASAPAGDRSKAPVGEPHSGILTARQALRDPACCESEDRLADELEELPGDVAAVSQTRRPNTAADATSAAHCFDLSGQPDGAVEEPPSPPPHVGAPRQLSGRSELDGPVLLIVPAGTVVVFLDTTLHASGPNTSRHSRRAWMPQFSSAPILHRLGGQPVGLAVPLGSLQTGG